jgi:hypothetical protein
VFRNSEDIDKVADLGIKGDSDVRVLMINNKI